jgi:tRNA G10  N-methylase Trm11
MVRALNQAGIPTIGTGGNFLAKTRLPDPRINAIITNPPYGDDGGLACQFIEHALELVPIVAMLLRVDFDSGVTRQHLFRNCPAFACKLSVLSRINWFPGKFSLERTDLQQMIRNAPDEF